MQRPSKRPADRIAAAARPAVEALERRLFLTVAPAGGEIHASVATAGRQHTAAVAADGDGDFVVAWASQNQDGSGDGVYARRFDAAGNPRQVPGAAAGVTEFRVNTRPPATSGTRRLR